MSGPGEIPAKPFVALSRFVVREPAMARATREAFVQRPHLVDAVSGFVRLDVICPRDRPEEFWLITYWTDEASFVAWHHSHAHKEAHAGIPKGLKLIPAETELSFFEHITS